MLRDALEHVNDISSIFFVLTHASSVLQITSEDVPVCSSEMPKESWLALRLPPASPFDNFLRAARG